MYKIVRELATKGELGFTCWVDDKEFRNLTKKQVNEFIKEKEKKLQQFIGAFSWYENQTTICCI